MDQEQEKKEMEEKKQDEEKSYPGKFIVDILKVCLEFKQFGYGAKKPMLK